jgi:hypothetical protein
MLFGLLLRAGSFCCLTSHSHPFKDFTTIGSMAFGLRYFIVPILLLVLFAQKSFVYGDSTVTITDVPVYSSQRPCAQNCIEYTLYQYTYLPLAGSLGCNLNPLENSCFCRTDLVPSGASILSNCISSGCSGNTNDIQSAESIYLNYCSSNGYSTVAAATATTTTSSTESHPTTSTTIFTAIQTTSISPTQTTSSTLIQTNLGSPTQTASSTPTQTKSSSSSKRSFLIS